MSSRSVQFFEYPRMWSDDKEDLLSIIDDVASTGGFILQKAVSDFETELANYTGTNYAVGVGNATDGMEIFLEAIGIQPGDEIIISSHTMLATASAIKVCGGVPIPVDIGYDNLICPEAIEEAITSNTVGIMPTQLNGRICDMDAILTIAKKHNLFLVEDAAQALGSKYKGQHAGTFGLASDISFFPAKVLGCLGDAGGVLVNDKELFHKIYQIHDHGRDVDGEIKRWGRNSRLDNLQAAILSHKLKSYKNVIERRREVGAGASGSAILTGDLFKQSTGNFSTTLATISPENPVDIQPESTTRKCFVFITDSIITSTLNGFNTRMSITSAETPFFLSFTLAPLASNDA